jgi:general secretion pathway protein K
MKLRNRKIRRDGFVLVVVLCMTIMLAGLLFAFNSESRLALRNVDDFRESQKALNCATAGLNVAIAAIIEPVDEQKEQTLPAYDLAEDDEFEIAGGRCSLDIVEEGGKLNINLLKNEKGGLNRTLIDQLLRLIDLLNKEDSDQSRISYSIVPVIIDWTDSDEEVTQLSFVKRENMGVESPYYEKLDVPYKSKNAPFDTIEELLLVKDVTPEIFGRMRGYLTVYGDGKININHAPKRVIESLSEEMDSFVAKMIIERREVKPFKSVSELREIPGMTGEIYNSIRRMITVDEKGQYYCVTSKGRVGEIDSTITAILRKNKNNESVETVLYKEN